MEIVITHGFSGVAWTIYDKATGELMAHSEGEHLTEMGAKEEAMIVLKVIQGSKEKV